MTPKTKEIVDKEVKFLNVDIKYHTITYSVTEKGEGKIDVEINGEKRSYIPIRFFEYLFITFSRNADRAILPDGNPDLNEQARAYLALKSHVTQIGERFKRAMIEKNVGHTYDFTDFYKQVEAPVQRARLELDIKLLDSQTHANESTIDTNKNIKSSNKVLKIIFGITTGIYLAQLIVSIYGLSSSKNVSPSQLQLQQQDSLIRTMEIRYYQKENQVFRQKHEIDSLKHSLDSVSRKP